MSGYVGEVRPELADLDKCTRCGLCEQACPTYRVLHFEPDSPRGRVFLMKEVAQGEAPISQHLSQHLYQCLGCRACETVCPAGVPYGKLLERARFQIEAQGEISQDRRGWRRFRSIAFERVLPNQWLFRAIMAPARLAQGLPGVLSALRALPLPPRLRKLVRMLPDSRAAQPIRRVRNANGSPRQARSRVGLFTGCVMRSLFNRVHAATANVLERNGYEVVVPRGQWCCGALNVHAGERTRAQEMAIRNIDAFMAAGVEWIVVNSAGCGAILKEYGELLGDDVQVHAFCSKVKDVHELLAERRLQEGLAPLSTCVTYHDACHLAHGQRIRRQPRELLAQLPGVEYVELPGADECCGAAGVYSLTHPELAETILEKKIEAIAGTGAQVVATANPGCAMQIQAGLLDRGLPIRVCHPMELIAESYSAGPKG